MLDLVEDASPDVVPPGAVRMLAYVLAKHADPDGATFVGLWKVAKGMGYRLAADGSLSEGARTSIWRTVRKAVQLGVIARLPCDCAAGVPRHPWHFRLRLQRDAAGRVSVAERLREAAPVRSRSATVDRSRTATSTTLRVPPGSTYRPGSTQTPSGFEPARQHRTLARRVSRRHLRRSKEQDAADRLAAIRRQMEYEAEPYDPDNLHEADQATGRSR